MDTPGLGAARVRTAWHCDKGILDTDTHRCDGLALIGYSTEYATLGRARGRNYVSIFRCSATDASAGSGEPSRPLHSDHRRNRATIVRSLAGHVAKSCWG